MYNIFYTYIHKKPNGEIFYVGKGKNKRAWSKHSRSKFWSQTVKKYGYFVEVVADRLSEEQAFELEEFIISYCKSRSDGGTLVNLTTVAEGISGYRHTEETKKILAGHSKGKNNPRVDKTIYTFINVYTNEEYSGTRWDFKVDKNVNPSNLLYLGTLISDGWYLKENAYKITKPFEDRVEYSFTHEDGTTLKLTRKEFMKATGVSTKPLFLVNRPTRVLKGWCLTENLYLPTLSVDYKYPLYTFQNEDGRVIYATRYGFKKQTGINPCKFFKTKPHHNDAPTYGWSLSL